MGLSSFVMAPGCVLGRQQTVEKHTLLLLMTDIVQTKLW
jgi:hypothetical protein